MSLSDGAADHATAPPLEASAVFCAISRSINDGRQQHFLPPVWRYADVMQHRPIFPPCPSVRHPHRTFLRSPPIPPSPWNGQMMAAFLPPPPSRNTTGRHRWAVSAKSGLRQMLCAMRPSSAHPSSGGSSPLKACDRNTGMSRTTATARATAILHHHRETHWDCAMAREATLRAVFAIEERILANLQLAERSAWGRGRQNSVVRDGTSQARSSEPLKLKHKTIPQPS